jgi:quinoprotein glucose dehydrogenase
MAKRYKTLLPRVFGAVLGLIGLCLLIGGIELAGLGGSPYYAFAGLAVVASGVLLWRGRRAGMWLYSAMLAGTFVWSLWEVGLNGWGLAARLVAPCVLGLLFLLPPMRARLS